MVTWGVGPNSNDTITLGVTAKQLWVNGIVLANDNKATIVRIRGEIAFMMLTGGVGDGFSGAVGLGIVQADAFAAGATSCPGALIDSDWDGWMWHSFFHLYTPAANVGPAGGDQLAGLRLTIDSKAMRKIEDSEVLLGSLEAVEEGTATAEMWADSRILFKLS